MKLPFNFDVLKAVRRTFMVYLTAQAAFIVVALVLLGLSLAVVFHAINVPSNREHVPPLPAVVHHNTAKPHQSHNGDVLFGILEGLVGRGPGHTKVPDSITVTSPGQPPVTLTNPAHHTPTPVTKTTPTKTPTVTVTTPAQTTTTPQVTVTQTTTTPGGLVSTVANGAGNVVTTTGNTVGGVVSTVTQNTPVAPLGFSLSQTITTITKTLGGVVKGLG